MPQLVTRFHLLLLWVTLALTAVGFFRIAPDYLYPAHWSAEGADWLWPRDWTLIAAPLVQLLLLAAFFALGKRLSRSLLLQTQHILDPALTLAMMSVAGVQLGMLLTGVGSDIDFVRLTAGVLGAILLVLGAALFGAERHAYGGLRLPWRVGERAWTLVHRISGLGYAATGAALLAQTWLDPGLAVLVMSMAAALSLPVFLAALATTLFR